MQIVNRNSVIFQNRKTSLSYETLLVYLHKF
jgi:hypothetical protein